MISEYQHFIINSNGARYKERAETTTRDVEKQQADATLTAKRRRAEGILDAAEFDMSVEDFLQEGHF